MSFACHSYVLVCHPYVTRMYSYVIRISLVYNRMSFVCHSYVIVCHPYVTRMCSHVTRMYSYVIRMSLICTRRSSICHSYVVLPWTLLHWLRMLKLSKEVQFTKFMSIFLYFCGHYTCQMAQIPGAKTFCKLNAKNIKPIFLDWRRRRSSFLFIQYFKPIHK